MHLERVSHIGQTNPAYISDTSRMCSGCRTGKKGVTVN